MKKALLFIYFSFLLIVASLFGQGDPLSVSIAKTAKDSLKGYTPKYVDSIFIDWRAKGDSVIYFGIHSSQAFLLDTLQLNIMGLGIIRVPDNLVAGMYFIGFPGKKGLFDFIYEKKSLRIVIDANNNPTYPDSKVNQDMLEYFDIIFKLNKVARKFSDKNVKENEKVKLTKEYQVVETQKSDFIDAYLAKKTGNYLELLFRLEKIPSLSDLPLRTRQDTIRYVQEQANRYWSYVNLSDERIINSPLINPKLDYYFDNILPLNIDTHKKRAIEVIEMAKGNEKTKKFILTYILNRYIQSKYIGFDGVFLEVYLKYLFNQNNDWLGEENIKNIDKKVNQIYFNQLDAPAKDFTLLDSFDKPFNALSAKGEDGLVIVFWDPTCSHCKREIPDFQNQIKENVLKNGGKIKILGVMIDGGKDNWIEFINSKQLSSDLWVHGYDTKEMREKDYANNIPNYRQLYGIDQTPVYYFLDKNLTIKAKGNLKPEHLIDIINAVLKTKNKK